MSNQCSIMTVARIHEYGNPTKIQYEDLPIPDLQPGEVLINVKAAGINYIDIYMRNGTYARPLPHPIGLEGAGIVTAIGKGVSTVKIGDRVAWTDVHGSYASDVIADAARLVLLPANLTFEQGAAAMLQGMTGYYLTHGAYWLKPGNTCLIHAAAGGVGLLLCQIAKMLGARVIGTVSTAAKAKLARAAGADDIIFYTKQDLVTEVAKLTQQVGVNVVYDSVGKDTFEKSLGALKRRGTLVSFGQSSGPIPPFNTQLLSAKSLFLTRPTLFDYVVTREELVHHAQIVFDWISSGKLKLRIDRTYPLRDAASAHQALESRQTTGKLLLIP